LLQDQKNNVPSLTAVQSNATGHQSVAAVRQTAGDYDFFIKINYEIKTDDIDCYFYLIGSLPSSPISQLLS